MAGNNNDMTRRELGRQAALAGGAIAASTLPASGAASGLERRQVPGRAGPGGTGRSGLTLGAASGAHLGPRGKTRQFRCQLT